MFFNNYEFNTLLLSIKSLIKKDKNLLELLKGSSVFLFFKVFSIASGYILIFILDNLHGEEGVGIFSTAWTILMIGAVIGKLGFDSSIVRLIAEANYSQKYKYIRNVYKRSLFIIIVSGCITTCLLFVTAEPLSKILFTDYSNSKYIKVLSFAIIPLAVFQYNAEAFKGLKKVIHFAVFQNGTVYFIIIAILFIISKFQSDPINIFFALLFSTLMLMLISFLAIHKVMPAPENNSNPQEKTTPYKQLLSITIPMLLTNSLFLIMNWTDILMLSYFKDEASVGIYNTCLKIAALNTIAQVAITNMAMPKFAEIYSNNNRGELKRVVKQTSFLITVISLPIFVIIITLPEFLLNIFGQEYIKGREVLIILAVGHFFSAFSGATINLLNMTGQERIVKNILIITTLLNIILNYALIPKYGIKGSAISTMISTVSWNLLSTVLIFRKHGFLAYPILNPKHLKKLKKRIF